MGHLRPFGRAPSLSPHDFVFHRRQGDITYVNVTPPTPTPAKPQVCDANVDAVAISCPGLHHHVRMPPWPTRAPPPRGRYAASPPQPLHCPSIHITAIGATNGKVDSGSRGVQLGAEDGHPEAAWSRDQLYLPNDPCYRDTPLCPRLECNRHPLTQ